MPRSDVPSEAVTGVYQHIHELHSILNARYGYFSFLDAVGTFSAMGTRASALALNEEESKMKSKVKIAAVTAMLGVATTTAFAQTPAAAHPFVERYRQMQSLVTSSAYARGAPVLRDAADAPIGQESFAERFASMQRISANSPQFEAPSRPATAAADPVGNESFAERFREMQAVASDSGRFAFQPGTDELASEANRPLAAARPLRGVKPRDAHPAP